MSKCYYYYVHYNLSRETSTFQRPAIVNTNSTEGLDSGHDDPQHLPSCLVAHLMKVAPKLMFSLPRCCRATVHPDVLPRSYLASFLRCCTMYLQLARSCGCAGVPYSESIQKLLRRTKRWSPSLFLLVLHVSVKQLSFVLFVHTHVRLSRPPPASTLLQLPTS